jgi:methionine-rich copper-binding protein CopC
MLASLSRLTITSALVALPAVAHAQIRASEVGSMSQIIDGTKITMEYSRPRA